jgi:hypothetical protein
MDCFTKILTIIGTCGERIIFTEERKVISSCSISIMTTRKPMRKGCPAYLAHVKEMEKGKMELTSIPLARKFPNAFLEELPRLPSVRKIEVSIEVLPRNTPITKASYRMLLLS